MAYKILVVDDHPETRSIICHVLQQRGYHAVSAPNGA
jgi:CheY-like chemotaxis protein